MEKINIKNYTSSVAAEQSILNIERLLVQFGAANIMKEYDGFGSVNCLSFRIKFKDEFLSFQLPAKVDPILKLFVSQKKTSLTVKQKEVLKQQAVRTALKNIHDWVFLQLTMVQLEQMEITEAFISHLLTAPGQTLYQQLKQSEFKALK